DCPPTATICHSVEKVSRSSERRLPGLNNRFFRCSLELRRAPQLRACCSTGGEALTSARICGSGTTRSLKRPAHISSRFGPCSNRDAGHHHCPQPRTGRCGNRRRCCACGRVIVLPNVTIGRGAIVTAGSVITKSVLPKPRWESGVSHRHSGNPVWTRGFVKAVHEGSVTNPDSRSQIVGLHPQTTKEPSGAISCSPAMLLTQRLRPNKDDGKNTNAWKCWQSCSSRPNSARIRHCPAAR